jgi:hypothetical protein
VAVYITGCHLMGATRHEHISRVRWQQVQSGEPGECSRDVMIDWLRKDKGQAYVLDGSRRVPVGVVDTNPPHLRTYADGVWNDDLLSLPTY